MTLQRPVWFVSLFLSLARDKNIFNIYSCVKLWSCNYTLQNAHVAVLFTPEFLSVRLFAQNSKLALVCEDPECWMSLLPLTSDLSAANCNIYSQGELIHLEASRLNWRWRPTVAPDCNNTDVDFTCLHVLLNGNFHCTVQVKPWLTVDQTHCSELAFVKLLGSVCCFLPSCLESINLLSLYPHISKVIAELAPQQSINKQQFCNTSITVTLRCVS